MYKTWGFGINLVGIVRLLGVASPELRKNGFFKFVGNHADIHFNYSSFESDRSALNDTSFNGFVIRIF